MQSTITRAQLEAMKKTDLRTVDRSCLRDIRDVQQHPELPERERILDFIEQIGNPYCFKCGKIVIKLTFCDTDVSLQKRLEEQVIAKAEQA